MADHLPSRRSGDTAPPSGTPEPDTVRLVIHGRFGQAQCLELAEQIHALIAAGGDSPYELVCDVGGITGADLGTVDALARVTLTCRRLGAEIRINNAPPDLRNLMALAGLARVVRLVAASAVEPRRKSEEWEEPRGIQEEGDPVDATAGELEDL